MFNFVVFCSDAHNDPAVAIAASRAGSLGVLDLGFADDHALAVALARRLAEHARGRWGVLVDDAELLAAVLSADLDGLDTVVLAGDRGDELPGLVESVHGAGPRAWVVATNVEHAVAAQHAGADGVIAKGHEAGGWIGEEGSFVLLQRMIDAVEIPVWAHGGIGVHTVTAAYVAGAAGAVLDSQLLLTRESPLTESERAPIASMDGSETVTPGLDLSAPFRVYDRPGLEPVAQLRELDREMAGEDPRGAWRSAVKAAIAGGARRRGLLPIGQDGSFAADLAQRFGTVAGVIDGLRAAIVEACAALAAGNPLGEGSPLAQSHGTRYPIVQGPMTRVSDRAEFAAAVAEAGGLPFLALALMRGTEVDPLLARTSELLGDRPWGVGILGFVPKELRDEQLEVVRAHRPPFALIAGGRPDQALALEQEGISSYLHVPSPGLLKLYLAQGARRFVFEGRECGGHVGPRTSFALWETMLRVLLSELPAGDRDCHVVFAGGIHDARSAAMVGAMAAGAARRGVRTGVLLGTAYLFCQEATEAGAITPAFQQAAIDCTETVLLESGPGHATRCLPSPFVDYFLSEKLRLRGEGLASEEVRGELEQLNIGRLRIASKGVDRNPEAGANGPKLVAVDPAHQWEQGMYMIGEVASLRHDVTTLAQLHREVSIDSGELLAAVTVAEPVAAAPPAPADVAIVGLGAILPGAPDVETFWANILDKVDAIREVPTDRWDWHRMYDPDPAARDKVYSRWGGFIDPVEFDPLALGMPPKSLSSIEPFQLLALITAQAALRNAGYETRPFDRERTSVILGAGGGGADLSVGYTVRSALPSLLGDGEREQALQDELFGLLPEWTEDSFPGLLMNVAAGRIANRLDFGGTNFTVDAACASSLAAIALATRELQMGTSDMVLAGGVDAIQNPFSFLCFSKTHALSPRGRCRPFDATADGIAISEGFATVVLKRLADAERDGDRIYAVIRGVGAASDGRDRSLTAPRPEGQMRAMRRAYQQAGVSPSTVGLVEAHGTGTVAGDGAEVQSLSALLTEHSTPSETCAIGSVKSMIGHTKATAGVAGLIKASLALHHRVLPPTIGVTEPNPKASEPGSPIYVNSEARPWLTGGADHPRRAGVSAYGFGGTDFHIVLEEYGGGYLATGDTTVDRWPAELLLWRGSREGIAASTAGLAAKLAAGETPALDVLAQALARAAGSPAPGRSALGLVVSSHEDLRAKLVTAAELLAGDAARVHGSDGVHWVSEPLAADGGLAFLFPGQGSQRVDMARELAIAFPEAADRFELADRVLAGHYEKPLSRYIFPPPTFSPQDRRERQRALTDTHVAQAALGAAELAYLEVLGALGVRAQMTAGHSYGELVALRAAGGLDDQQLLALSEARGRFMRDASAGEAGAMAAVEAAPDALAPVLNGHGGAGANGDGHDADGRRGVVAANLNSPRQTVLSGPRASVEAALAWCQENGFAARELPVACAFHSPHVAGARDQFAGALAQTAIAVPRIPVYSNTTARAHSDEPAAIAEVLAQHLVRPVEFVEQIRAMHRDGARVFVEVGPRPVLTGLVSQILDGEEHVAVAVDPPGRAGLVGLTHCLAALATEGVALDTERLFRGRGAPRGGAGRPARGPALRWLVDGGSAWPADQPHPTKTTINPTPEERNVSTTSTNGAGMPVPLAAVHPPASAPRPADGHPPAPPARPDGHHAPAPAPVAPPAPVPQVMAPVAAAPDRAAEVMTRYQQLMQHFLETQRDVMLGYLGSARQGAPARPAIGAPAPVAPPAPAPVPAQLAPPAPTPPALAIVPAAAAAPAPAAAPAATLATVPGPAAPALVPEVLDGADDVTLSHDEIQAKLLEVVSERTGYPADMLSLDGDLEGDLGIDSIKRVEIAGTFTQDLGARQRASIDMEMLTASRTLREVVAVIEEGMATAGNPQPAGELRPFSQGPAETERIGRFVVHAASAPPITTSGGLAQAGAVVIVDDETGLGAALAAALHRARRPALLLPGLTELADETDAQALVARLREEHGAISALVHLAPAGADYGGLTTLFSLVRALAGDLQAAARSGGAAVLGVTRLGGAFGVDGGEGPAEHGAITGFLKTLALEWPEVRVKAVDLPADPGDAAAEQLLGELMATDGLVEVGYRDGTRTRLELVADSLREHPEAPAIDADSVVVLTGGARGITAAVALQLATDHRPTLVLIGRTPDAAEPEHTAALTDTAALRAALIQARRDAGEDLKPALVEADCRRILQGRELRENLEALRAAGATVDYRRCDASDPDAFGALIEQLYERYGRIDGVVHGAGVIEDRLIVDKRPESVARVLATKAGAARTLAGALRPEGLRFLVMFSSVSGRFGNRGQSDYAAASEVLNKLAQELDRRWPAHVVSINWGPWRSAGMVSPALEQEFAKRGVALIDTDAGCRMLAQELGRGAKGQVEVVIGAATGLSAPPARAERRTLPLLTGAELEPGTGGARVGVRRFSVARDRYLGDHRVDGRPVLPFAVAMELMAEMASLAAPERTFAGLRAIRLFNGVTVADDDEVSLRISATPAADGAQLDTLITGLDTPRPHYRAVAVLDDAAPTARPQPPAPAALPDLAAFPMSIAEAYRELLFHGPLFQGIERIHGMDARGATALLRPSQPQASVTGTDGQRWLLDPVLLDSALQVQVIWARLQWDATLLPAEIGGYDRFDAPRDGELVAHEMRIRGESNPPMCHVDHWFYGSDGRLLATLTNVVGVGTKALNRLAGSGQAAV